MNLSVTHGLKKGNFKSVFRITKMLINFTLYICYQTLLTTKQETQSKIGCGGEKSSPKAKGQSFIIVFEHIIMPA